MRPIDVNEYSEKYRKLTSFSAFQTYAMDVALLPVQIGTDGQKATFVGPHALELAKRYDGLEDSLLESFDVANPVPTYLGTVMAELIYHPGDDGLQMPGTQLWAFPVVQTLAPENSDTNTLYDRVIVERSAVSFTTMIKGNYLCQVVGIPLRAYFESLPLEEAKAFRKLLDDRFLCF